MWSNPRPSDTISSGIPYSSLKTLRLKAYSQCPITVSPRVFWRFLSFFREFAVFWENRKFFRMVTKMAKIYSDQNLSRARFLSRTIFVAHDFCRDFGQPNFGQPKVTVDRDRHFGNHSKKYLLRNPFLKKHLWEACSKNSGFSKRINIPSVEQK